MGGDTSYGYDTCRLVPMIYRVRIQLRSSVLEATVLEASNGVLLRSVGIQQCDRVRGSFPKLTKLKSYWNKLKSYLMKVDNGTSTE